MKSFLLLLAFTLAGSHTLWSDYCSSHFFFVSYDTPTAEVVCGDAFATPKVEAAKRSIIDGQAKLSISR